MSIDERRQDHLELREKVSVLSEKVVSLETQMKRMVSDAESEKETRRRSNAGIFDRFEELNDKIFAVNRTIWIATGAIAMLVFIANFLTRHS